MSTVHTSRRMNPSSLSPHIKVYAHELSKINIIGSWDEDLPYLLSQTITQISSFNNMLKQQVREGQEDHIKGD